eukprot:964696_1
MLLTVEDGIANSAKTPTYFRKFFQSTDMIDFTICPLTSEILIERNVLATKNSEKKNKFSVSLERKPGTTIEISLRTFFRKIASTRVLRLFALSAWAFPIGCAARRAVFRFM